MNTEKKLTGYPSIDKPWLKYYSYGADKLPVPEKTVYQLIYDNQSSNGKNIALKYIGRKISYDKLFANIELCAKSLKSLGIKKGDIVTLALPTSPEVVYLFYALNRIGAISNAIDPRLKAEELSISINETNSCVIFATDMTIPELNKICDSKSNLRIVKISPLESAPQLLKLLTKKSNIKYNRIIEWKDFIKSGRTYIGTIDIPYEQGLVATIVHTGGTTGVPKGVMLTNENFNAMALIHEISGFDQLPKDRFLTFLPPFIAYCLANAINDPLYLGLEVTLIPKFDYKDFPKLVMKHKPNHVLGGPILWEYFIRSELTQNADLSFLKSPVSGGDVMNIELENRINEFFENHNCKIKIQQGYGMSEVAAAACFSTNRSYCAGSVGIPFVKNIISIFDVDTGEELTYGQEGEVCIQSPTTMKGYYNNSNATNELIHTHKDGTKWVHTGDLGIMNENGNLFIKGRMKRLIVRSGNKIFPQTVESIIMSHTNVINCAVVQMKHNEDRHVPIAYLVLNDSNLIEKTINDVKELIRDKMPEFNIPYKWIIKTQLALTSINKIDFKSLEKEAVAYENINDIIIKYPY